LGLSELQIGSLSTAYALMQLVMSPYWGRRSEKRGRRPVLLIGITGFAISFYAFAGAAKLGLSGAIAPWLVYPLLLGARLVGGALSSATIPTAQAYMADITDRGDRTSGMALIGAAFGLGIIFGPGIGAALATFGLLVPVVVSATLAVINAAFVWRMLPETERKPRPDEAVVSPRDRRLWPLLSLAVAVTLSSVAMEQTIAFYFQDRLSLSAEGTARSVGIALVLYGLVAVFAQGYVIRRFRFSPRTLMLTGVPIAIAGFALLVFADAFAELSVALSLQGLGQGFAMPGVTAALSLSVGEHEQGVVAGYNSAAQALGRLAGPLVGTGLYQVAPTYPYVFSACVLSLVLLALLLGGIGRRSPSTSGTGSEPPVM
jgi:MFS family permease